MPDGAPAGWVAGVLDARGMVRLRDVQGTLLPTLAVSTPDAALAARLAELTGTGVTRVRRDYRRHGCAEHCAERHLHVTSETWRWQATGARATVVLWSCLPLLCSLPGAAEALEAGLAAPRKAATAAKMRALGWALPDGW